MSPRIRKLIGTVLLLVLVFVYALLVIALAPAILKPDAPWVQLVFYVVAGLTWVIPAGALIKWMAKPGPGDRA
ncbi:MAG: DUF2842 domain-containing protein [Hyphomicrobiaceae bacterium]